eukprot:COSAG05_NODE_317_length_11545_cov_73.981391_15_plen_116_part_00
MASETFLECMLPNPSYFVLFNTHQDDAFRNINRMYGKSRSFRDSGESNTRSDYLTGDGDGTSPVGSSVHSDSSTLGEYLHRALILRITRLQSIAECIVNHSKVIESHEENGLHSQ